MWALVMGVGLGVMGACLPRVVRKKELDELEDVRTKLTWMMALVKSKTKETNISAIDAAFLASCVGRLEKVPKPWAFTSLPVIYWGGEDLLALRLRILPRIVEIERQLERHPERHPERHLEQRRERNMYLARILTNQLRCLQKACQTTGASPGEGITTLLVKHFDWTTNRCFDHGSGVRLRVGRGCLREGQVAGPINVITNERYIVECEGSSFLVSTVVDCQPSSTFEQPLDLENRIGGEDEDPKELEENHKTFWRESVSEPWKLLQGGTVDADCQEQGQFVLRAKVDHFSQFCFGYELNVLSAFQERQVTRGRPDATELEFLNGTDQRLLFLTLPTCFTDSKITSLTASASAAAQVAGGGIQVAGNASLEREVISVITSAGTDCQVVPVPARPFSVETSAAKQKCPHATCKLPPKTDEKLRVVVCTIDKGKVLRWLSQVFPPRTKLIILPALFDEIDGHYASSELAGHSNVVAATEMANFVPASTITTNGGSVGGSA